MSELDLDAIEADAARLVQLLSRAGDHPAAVAFRVNDLASKQVPALVAEVRRLRAWLAGEDRSHDADVESLTDDLSAVRTERDALTAKLDAFKPVAFPSGEQLYAHPCKNVEWWHEPSQGPINDQGCDACESAPYAGAWQPVYVRTEAAG